jgi:hypothetical protein
VAVGRLAWWADAVGASAGEFAIVLQDRPGQVDGILMLVDDARHAEEIAAELRAVGHDVEVQARHDPVAHAATP